jgi:uncharacterized protein involved in type VI secretion and phage assembly
MEGGLVESAARIDEPDDRRIYGLTVAQVVKNRDETHAGRVQVRFSWLPGYEPWARLALVDRGVFFIPQVGDEVLVNMNRGDVSEVYVVGCLWNGKDQPPAIERDDPVHKRIIKTPTGHNVTFDDQAGTVTITSADLKHITLTKDHIEIAIDEKATSAITIDKSGDVTIKAQTSIKLDAPSISISGQTIDVKSNSKTDISGGGLCSIDAGLIKIG